MSQPLAIRIAIVSELSAAQQDDLATILISVVEAGASVGFVAPLSEAEATAYWQGVNGPSAVLLIAEWDGKTVGTGQLDLAMRKNGQHRAEVCKVLVHPEHQGKGIGKALMLSLEQEARKLNRTLLHLDTDEGDKSNRLYLSVGYIPVGVIPDWASDGNGVLHGTTIYYKRLQND